MSANNASNAMSDEKVPSGLAAAWNERVEALAQKWAALAPRERRLLGIGFFVVAASIVYFLLFEPAFLGRKKLLEELPSLRNQLGQVESLGSEARRLTSVPTGLDNPNALKGLIEQSVTASGLKTQLTQVTQTGDLIEARFKAVSFNQWLLWLDSAVRETRMRVVDVAMTKEGAEGLASGKVVFEVSKRPTNSADAPNNSGNSGNSGNNSVK
jgi:general secretion pathway protein M